MLIKELCVVYFRELPCSHVWLAARARGKGDRDEYEAKRARDGNTIKGVEAIKKTSERGRGMEREKNEIAREKLRGSRSIGNCAYIAYIVGLSIPVRCARGNIMSLRARITFVPTLSFVFNNKPFDFRLLARLRIDKLQMR